MYGMGLSQPTGVITHRIKQLNSIGFEWNAVTVTTPSGNDASASALCHDIHAEREEKGELLALLSYEHCSSQSCCDGCDDGAASSVWTMTGVSQPRFSCSCCVKKDFGGFPSSSISDLLLEMEKCTADEYDQAIKDLALRHGLLRVADMIELQRKYPAMSLVGLLDFYEASGKDLLIVELMIETPLEEDAPSSDDVNANLPLTLPEIRLPPWEAPMLVSE